MISLLASILILSAISEARYNISVGETSVSGLSAGAFFANQVQVAHSSIIKGAGLIAGGPYDCGEETALAFCAGLSAPLVSLSIARTNQWSGHSIDDKSNLKRQKVYMISGTQDFIVSTSVMNQLYKYLVSESGFIPEDNVFYKKDLPSGHTFPTDFDGSGNNICSSSSSPFISNCGFDGAGAILNHIYGKLNPKRTGEPSGQWLEFDQSEFISNPRLYGLDTKGFLYVPKNCSAGHKCRLHIAFHGCDQSYSQIGNKFIKNTGFDRWADTNDLVIVYPQTYPDPILHLTPSNLYLNNLNACFDWIGWYGNDFPTKNGIQIKFIKTIIDKI